MSANPKEKRVSDRAYLDSQHDARCEITGQYGNGNETVEPMHIGGGMGIKRSDAWTIPVLHHFHALDHQRGTATMLRQCASDSLLLAMARAYAERRYELWRGGKL